MVVELKSGEYLFHEGDSAKYFYFVRSGQIFITKYAESGPSCSFLPAMAAEDKIAGC